MHWAVILAGGNGTRLQPLTQVLTGDDRPKQFCPLLGDQSLLSQTRTRVALNVEPARSLCVVTRDHERYYRHELSDLNPYQLVEQPANRGTAVAIAYSLARIGRHDKKAVVGFFPADHYYEDVPTLQKTIDETYAACAQRSDMVFLLGTEPDVPEVEYGWIEPGQPVATLGGRFAGVRRFWEKPTRAVAEDLLTRGCLWNMFIMIGTLGAFRSLLYSLAPETIRTLELLEQLPVSSTDAIDRAYRSLASVDFSRDVLGRQTDRLGVVRVPPVGWTDLGQPARVRTLLTARGAVPAALSVAS